MKMTNKTQEKNDFIAEERRMEAIQEQQDGIYSEWLNENKKTLKEDFIDDNKKLFQEFLSEVIISDEYDLEYWKEAFLEPYEDDFYYFCKERYGEYK